MIRLLLPALLLLAPLHGLAAEPEPLPDPLTLDAALAAIDDRHPLIGAASAGADALQAALAKARADDDASVDLTLELRRVEPLDDSPYDGRDDSRASVTLYKRLYDFGRTRHRIEAATEAASAGESITALAWLRLRRQVLRDYFDVLLADLAAATANEAMSVAYVRLDRARDQHELGRISEVELLELEDRYQKSFLARQRAEVAQRQTRERLALTLNHPGQPPATLEPPELPGLDKPLPDYDALLATTLRNSPELRAIDARLRAIDERRKAIRAQRHPELYLQLEAQEYRQTFGSRTPFRGTLGLEVPLYQGGRVDAGLGALEAERQQRRAERVETEYRIRETLLQTLQQIETLRLQMKQAAVREDYRELYLDRSRAQYELEIRTDLGDAMVEQSAARRFAEQTRFDLALALEQLVVLTGDPAWSALTPSGGENPPSETTP